MTDAAGLTGVDEATLLPDCDRTLPFVSLTAPGEGEQVSEVVSVTADANEDVGLLGVRFQLDGLPLGAEDLTPPYFTSWVTTTTTTTTTTANGGYVLTAVASDAAGNQTVSDSVNVVVNKVVTTPSSLVLALGFDDGSGSTAADVSGKGNDGTRSGASWTTQGRYDGALSFDGSNDWVTVADAPSLDLTTGMTLMAWVYPTTLSGWRTTMFKKTSNNFTYALYAHDNGPRPAAYFITGSENNVLGTSALPLNTWSHLAVTYDGSFLRLYVNANEVLFVNDSGTLSTSNQPLRIGGNNIWGEWFAGRIEEVRVYDVARTPAQILVDLNTPIAP